MGEVLPMPLLANGLMLIPIYLSGTLVLLGATVVGLLAVILSVSRVPVTGRWAAVLSIVASLGSFTTPLFYYRTMAEYGSPWVWLFLTFGKYALLPLALSALALVLAYRPLRRGDRPVPGRIVSRLLLTVAVILATWSLYLFGLDSYRHHTDPEYLIAQRMNDRILLLQWAAVLVVGLVLLGNWAITRLMSR
jgi:hypothetical protein